MSLEATFVAALRSVGTAGTLALAGLYLHRRGFVTAEGKKALARLSEQVTIPCLFFSKIIYCPQNFTREQCPSITDNLADIWVLLFWPLFVVGTGMLIGDLATRISGTPRGQRRAVIAACAFPNSTGIPITLLTVVHANFPQTSKLGRVDPNLFLSVYLILYPVLQWGIGGWLLASGDSDDEVNLSLKANGVHHVLNLPANDDLVVQCDAATKMIRELSLSDLLERKDAKNENQNSDFSHGSNSILLAPSDSSETSQLVPIDQPLSSTLSGNSLTALARNSADDIAPLMETLAKVLPKAFQPPVIGALLGLFVASIPQLRGLFVDLRTRSDSAPLEWFFDGIYSIGLAAVPINMCILGINLSITSMKTKMDLAAAEISKKTIVAVVIGKMVVMPIIGVSTTVLLKSYFWKIPEAIDDPFYLVLMMVTITPTANNVMVMVELSGNGAKEGMARIIAWQYAMAPILLSISVMIVVRVAIA